MSEMKELLVLDLALFDGGGGDGEGAVTGEAEAGPKEAAGRAEPDRSGYEASSDGLDQRRRDFYDYISKNQDLYDQEVRRLTERSTQQVQNLEKQAESVRPVLDLLMQRYQITDGDPSRLLEALEEDNTYWEQAAEEAGMTVEQYKQFQRLQRENEALIREQRQRQGQEMVDRQLRQWYMEAEETRKVYPSFSLESEVQNPEFKSMISHGVPVRHAYEVLHLNDIKAGVAQMTAQATEKQVTDNVRARGSRPVENGTSAQSGFVVKDDVSRLSKKERAELALRAQRGEIISF